MKLLTIKPQFVEFIPDQLEDGILYVSMHYATAAHLCLCGCGKEVATPFSPTDWRLSFDGSVSLSPSVGNWNFKCRSHYFITGNRVRWAADMSQKDIDAGRQRDQVAKERRYTHTGAAPIGGDDQMKQPQRAEAPESILSSFSTWLRSLWK